MKYLLNIRDERLEELEQWKTEHAKDHVQSPEVFRMHEEMRQLILQLMENQGTLRESMQKDFHHISERIDRLSERVATQFPKRSGA